MQEMFPLSPLRRILNFSTKYMVSILPKVIKKITKFLSFTEEFAPVKRKNVAPVADYDDLDTGVLYINISNCSHHNEFLLSADFNGQSTLKPAVQKAILVAPSKTSSTKEGQPGFQDCFFVLFRFIWKGSFIL